MTSGFGFLLVIINFAFCQVIQVELNDVDASYALDGTKLNKSMTFFVLSADGDDQIMIQSWFEDQDATNFTIWDGIQTIESKNLTEEAFFGPNLSLELSENENFRFGMVFRRVAKSKMATLMEAQRDFFYLDEITSYSVSIRPENFTHYVTFMHTLAYPYPQLDVRPYVDPDTPDCEMKLYSYGIPTEKGASKYLIYTFQAHDPSVLNYAASAVLSLAATIEVPPWCSGSIWGSKVGDFNFNTILLEEVIEHEGFIMSQGYPRPPKLYPADFDHDRPIQVTYRADDSFEFAKSTVFSIDVVSFSPGSPSGFLEINVGDKDQLNLTSQTNDLSFKQNGDNFEVIFVPANEEASMLVRFKSRTPLTDVTMTTDHEIASTITSKTDVDEVTTVRPVSTSSLTDRTESTDSSYPADWTSSSTLFKTTTTKAHPSTSTTTKTIISTTTGSAVQFNPFSCFFVFFMIFII